MRSARTGDRTAPVEWAVASWSHPDHTESGDHYVVATVAAGALLGVVDGIGHGSAAAEAARAAVATLQDHRAEPVVALVQRCNKALAATRGVVMSLASYDAAAASLRWIGVGNVAGVVVRADSAATPARQTLLLRGGVVGHQLPELRAAAIPVSPGDTLAFATDGIRGDFAVHLDADEPLDELAERILAIHGLKTDDALVLVVRFPGAGR